MRRGTLITLVVLFVLLVIAAIFQIAAGHGPRRYPGPGFTSTPTASRPVAPVAGGSPSPQTWA